MYKFFVKDRDIRDGFVYLKGDNAHHLKNVLRMRLGEAFYVGTDDDILYTCAVSRFLKDEVEGKIIDFNKPNIELPCEITLYQSLPKGDKMEFIIQKATELGVHRIVPVISKRCIKKLDQKKVPIKTERWNTIALEAARQSKRMFVPKIEFPIEFSEAVDKASLDDISFLAYENKKGIRYTRELLQDIDTKSKISIFIGPEGGYEESEVAYAEGHNIKIVSLGNRILRTETAGPAFLSILMFLLDKE